MRARPRHARPSRLRTLSCTAGLSTVVAVPLTGLTAAPAAAAPAPAAAAGSFAAGPLAVGPAAAVLPAAHPVAAPAAARATLRPGSRGAAVADLQRRLGGIAADGVFGPATAGAVRAFQTSAGLAADAVVGPRTWGALDGRPVSGRASRGGQRTASAAPAATSSSAGAAAVTEAARHAGKPYRYGATGPGAFDCSGFVQYVYRQVGVSVPRTSRQQAAAARPVPRGSEQLGDLIIFRSGGRVTHVGIYAGDGTMWVARRSGTTVTRQGIYSSTYSVGRFT